MKASSSAHAFAFTSLAPFAALIFCMLATETSAQLLFPPDPSQNFAPLRADDVMPRFKPVQPRDFDPEFQPIGPADLGQWGFGVEPDATGGGFCINRGNTMLYVPPGGEKKVYYQRIREWERRSRQDGHVEIWRYDDFRQVERYDIYYTDGSRRIGENPYPGNFDADRWQQLLPAPQQLLQ